jgi:glycosyltransferase involved in cell wall biosynthesis
MNRPEVLRQTLRNLCSQGLRDDILVLDGSENSKSEKVCEEFGVEHQFQDSSGMTAARNEALEQADSEFVVFVDDDVRVSDSWYGAITDAFDGGNVVGVTGKLEDEELEFGRLSDFIRNVIFGGKESFGEVLPSRVVNGDFFYDERKQVDHMPGCNMAFDVEALRRQGGFDEEFDVGSSYGEDTAASLRVAREGKIVYEPEASLKHLKVCENRNEDRRVFFDSYNTRFLQKKYDLVDGFSGLLRNLGVTTLRHTYYLISSVSSASPSRFVSYFKGDVLGLWDFWLRDRKPSDRF